MPSTKTEETSLYVALMRAQQAFGPVLKNATNPHLKSKYADLGSVIETITGPLTDNGLLFFQTIQPGADVPELVTAIALAATGDKIESRVPLISKDPSNPQSFGATLTYFRRYSLLAMCGIAPEDDDGHAATQQPTARATSPRPPTQQHSPVSGRVDITEAANRNGDQLPKVLPEYEKPANERRQLSDKEFDEEVRKALATKDSQQMLLLVEEAQDFTGRWIILAQNALSLQSLDWLERKAQAMGITSPAVANAFRKRREVIESGAEQELFR
jgi:hypothetical protein